MLVRIVIVWLLSLGLICAGACRRHRAGTSSINRAERHELVTALISAPLTFDPRGLTSADTAQVQQLLFRTILKKSQTYGLEADLAEKWEMDPTAMRLVAKLRAGITFHDGRPCRAQDVVYTYTSMMAEHTGKASAFSKLAEVKALDELTVEFRNREPNPGLPVDLVAVGIIPEGSSPTIADHPIGTGPFQFEAYQPSQWIRLKSFAGNSPASPQPQITLTIRILPDAATRELELASGSLDFLLDADLQPGQLEQWKSNPEWNVTVFPGGGLVYLSLNTENPLLKSVKARQALALAINRPEIINRVLGGNAEPALSPLPPKHWAISPNLMRFDFERQRATRLWQEANGTGPAKLTLLVTADANQRRIGGILQEHWRQIGVQVEIQSVETALYFERLRYGDYAIALAKLTGGNQFVTIFKGAFHSRAIHVRGNADTGELNYARYRNPEVDALIDQAQQSPFSMDQATEASKYLAIQKKIVEEAPWIFLWHPSHVLVARTSLDGFEFPPGGSGEVYARVHYR